MVHSSVFTSKHLTFFPLVMQAWITEQVSDLSEITGMDISREIISKGLAPNGYIYHEAGPHMTIRLEIGEKKIEHVFFKSSDTNTWEWNDGSTAS